MELITLKPSLFRDIVVKTLVRTKFAILDLYLTELWANFICAFALLLTLFMLKLVELLG